MTMNASGFPVLDEDDMSSDSATATATQQSIKAYVDNNAGGNSATLETINISSQIIELTAFNNAVYSRYDVFLRDIVADENNVSYIMRTSSNGGSSYDSGASNYVRGLLRLDMDGTGSIVRSSSGGTTQILLGLNVGNGTNETFKCRISIDDPGASTYTKISINDGIYYRDASSDWNLFWGAGIRRDAGVVDAIEIKHSGTTGEFTSGTAILVGYTD